MTCHQQHSRVEGGEAAGVRERRRRRNTGAISGRVEGFRRRVHSTGRYREAVRTTAPTWRQRWLGCGGSVDPRRRHVMIWVLRLSIGRLGCPPVCVAGTAVAAPTTPTHGHPPHLPHSTLYSALHSASAMAKRAHGAAFATGIPEGMFVSAGTGLDAPEPQVCSQSRSSMLSRAHPPTDAVLPHSFIS